MNASPGIEKRYLDAICAVAADFSNIEKLWLYGSRARGDWRPDSDIDLAVEGDMFDLVSELDFRARLEDLPVIFKFDVLSMANLKNDALRQNIQREGCVIFSRADHLSS